MEYEYLVPKDTKRVLPQKLKECLNLGLILARFIPHEVIRNDDIDKNTKARPSWLSNTLNGITLGALKEVISENLRRWEDLTAHALRFEMVARGRLIIGLGSKGPLEFGITLHPITGVPYIPGSALKGLCRSYALLSLAAQDELFVDNRKTESERLEDFDAALLAGQKDHLPQALHYRLAFGTQKNAGGCVFYDAVLSGLNLTSEPLSKAIYTLDVMTPHFAEYYTNQGGKAPDDSGNPIPVTYITVSERTYFAFAIGKRTGFVDQDNETSKQARRWLKSALQELGIGAKTAQGYGVFAILK